MEADAVVDLAFQVQGREMPAVGGGLLEATAEYLERQRLSHLTPLQRLRGDSLVRHMRLHRLRDDFHPQSSRIPLRGSAW